MKTRLILTVLTAALAMPSLAQNTLRADEPSAAWKLLGKEVLDYELGSDAVKAGVATGKFKNVPDFGTKLTGQIMLTDHQDEAWYRNIKIREL
jgi:hypothetical protein